MNRGAWLMTEEIIECYRDISNLEVIGGPIWGNDEFKFYVYLGVVKKWHFHQNFLGGIPQLFCGSRNAVFLLCLELLLHLFNPAF
ncbi:hypothetical protein CCP3SC5AM1_1940006 [Gammaproteobacteria bacterium]